MKYFKKFLLLGIFALLGVSFCGAGYSYISRSAYSFSVSNTHYDFISDGNIICISPRSNSYSSDRIKVALLDGGFDNNSNLLPDAGNPLYGYNLLCFNESFGIEYLASSSHGSYGFYFYSGFSNLVNVSCDCSEYETQINSLSGFLASCNGLLNTCENSVNSLSGSLASCNGLLNTCENSVDSLSGSLVTCQNSLNYSSSSLSNCQNSLNSCLSANCPDIENNVSWSALWINDIQHVGASNIYITIPEEISRDYSYFTGSMTIDVEGYYYDTGYINDILTIQEYHPSSEDFTVAFVSFLTLGLPYVVVALFVVFIRKLIRKIFKS